MTLAACLNIPVPFTRKLIIRFMSAFALQIEGCGSVASSLYTTPSVFRRRRFEPRQSCLSLSLFATYSTTRILSHLGVIGKKHYSTFRHELRGRTESTSGESKRKRKTEANTRNFIGRSSGTPTTRWTPRRRKYVASLSFKADVNPLNFLFNLQVKFRLKILKGSWQDVRTHCKTCCQ